MVVIASNKHTRNRIITRFCKVMFGMDYTKFMYLPPKFAKTMKHLAGQVTQVEDSSGRKWSLKLSYVDDSLAFQKGWDKFFLDHGLEDGELLIFNYVKRSHFVVQIYGRDGCERINFKNGGPQQNKRSRRDQETDSQDEPFQTLDVNSGDKPNSATSVASGSEFQNPQPHSAVANADFGRLPHIPIAITMEDPSCMTKRDDGYYQNILHDLSIFEMEKEIPAASKFEKAIDAKIAPCNTESMESANKFEEVLESKTVPCHTGIMGQTKAKGGDTLMAVIFTNQIDGHSGEIFTDKLEKALGTKVAPSHADSMVQSNIKESDAKMAGIHANQIDGNSSDIFTDKFEKAFDIKMPPSQVDSMEQSNIKENDAKMVGIYTNQINGSSGDIFVDKFAKAFDTKITPSHTKISDLTKTTGDDAQMAVTHSNVIADHSDDIFTSNFHPKPFDSTLSKDMYSDVSNLQNAERTCTVLFGKNHVLASDIESPCMGSTKIAGSEYAVKRRRSESEVFSSMFKDAFGKHIKKELVELGEEANGFSEVACGKEPTMVRKHGQVFSSVVKVEPDLSYDIVPPFSAEVKTQSYLELPISIPSAPGRRERVRGKVVYLRDPNGRLWPVLYPDVFPVKALTANWRQFCKKNHIKPGDECRFHVENGMLSIYRVDVTRRLAESSAK